ncbi:hypothetical protein OED01_00715 [Microbacterium sp. M28]|uniref:hypothetical protein n=1 Tax=Microbacterium sp. M28 TaxID=2962064 RepID=UPI0021F4A962|nr:hypothetical protein [Microbacterium sp. M28]UYO97284.1 hypothetical protein OED01_00715 [Microbacterium sp. M28]
MSNPNSMVLTKIACGGHEHEMCVSVGRGIPPELRCPHSSHGGGVSSGCALPFDLNELVERELREKLQESKRQRYVLVRL